MASPRRACWLNLLGCLRSKSLPRRPKNLPGVEDPAEAATTSGESPSRRGCSPSQRGSTPTGRPGFASAQVSSRTRTSHLRVRLETCALANGGRGTCAFADDDDGAGPSPSRAGFGAERRPLPPSGHMRHRARHHPPEHPADNGGPQDHRDEHQPPVEVSVAEPVQTAVDTRLEVPVHPDLEEHAQRQADKGEHRGRDLQGALR